MRKIIYLLLVLSLTGCMFIVREGEDIKSIGITKEKAKQEIVAIDQEYQSFHKAPSSVNP